MPRAVKRGNVIGRGEPTSFRRTDRQELRFSGPCVYAVRTKDGLVKIGWTSDLGQRLGDYRLTARDVLAVRLGATPDDEAAIHKRLSGHAVRGREWYNPQPEVLAVINDMRDDLGLAAIVG